MTYNIHSLTNQIMVSLELNLEVLTKIHAPFIVMLLDVLLVNRVSKCVGGCKLFEPLIPSIPPRMPRFVKSILDCPFMRKPNLLLGLGYSIKHI